MNAIVIILTWVLAASTGAPPAEATAEDAQPTEARRVLARFNGEGIEVRWFPKPPGFRTMLRAYRVERTEPDGTVVPIHHEPISPVVNVGALRQSLGGLADPYIALIESVSPNGRVTNEGFNEAMARQVSGGIMLWWATTYPEVAEVMGMRRVDRDLQPRARYSYRVIEIDAGGRGEETVLGTDTAVAAIESVGPPVDLLVEQIGDELVSVSWDRDLEREATDDIVRYSVLRQEQGRDQPVIVVNPGAPSALRAHGDSTIAEYLDRDVTEGKTYKYWVVAIDVVGGRSKPAVAGSLTLKDERLPPPPTDVVVSPGHKQLSLAWSATGLPEDVAGFEVLEVRRDNRVGGRPVGGRIVARTKRDKTAVQLPPVSRPGHYEWAVRSVDAAGNAGVLGLPVELDVPRPVVLKPPGGLKAERKPDDGWIRLRWRRGGGPDAVGYVLERRVVGSEAPPTRVNHAPIPTRETEWLERVAPLAGEALEWRLRSQDGAGRYSRPSAWVGLPDVRPPLPAHLAPARAVPGGVHLTWQAPGDERITGFTVQAQVGSGGWSGVSGGRTGPAVRSFLDKTRRPAETTVRYRLVSEGATVQTPVLSNVTSVWAGGERPLTAPDKLTAKCGRGAVSLQWKAVPGATGYDIQRAVGDEPLEGRAVTSGARWDDRTVVADSRYRYQVRAVYRNRVGPPSAVAAVGCDSKGKTKGVR